MKFLQPLRRSLLTALFAFPLIALAQAEGYTPPVETPVDSVTYYRQHIQKLWRESQLAVQQSEAYQTLHNRLTDHINKRNNYAGLVLFGDVTHSDYSQFNRLLAADGFPPLDEIGFRFGFGISQKRRHNMLDIYVAVIGFEHQSKKGAETISTSFSNLACIDYGYDLLKQERFSLYPYAGISLRSSELDYQRSGGPNPSYTSLADMRTDENKVELESFGLGYQYGLGFDYAFSYNKARTYKTILFLKAGVNRPFKEETYKDEDIKSYKPGIRQGDWLVSIGFKFANKR